MVVGGEVGDLGAVEGRDGPRNVTVSASLGQRDLAESGRRVPPNYAPARPLVAQEGEQALRRVSRNTLHSRGVPEGICAQGPTRPWASHDISLTNG